MICLAVKRNVHWVKDIWPTGINMKGNIKSIFPTSTPVPALHLLKHKHKKSK